VCIDVFLWWQESFCTNIVYPHRKLLLDRSKIQLPRSARFREIQYWVSIALAKVHFDCKRISEVTAFGSQNLRSYPTWPYCWSMYGAEVWGTVHCDKSRTERPLRSDVMWLDSCRWRKETLRAVLIMHISLCIAIWVVLHTAEVSSKTSLRRVSTAS